MIRKINDFIKRSIFTFILLLNKKREPYYNLKYILIHFINQHFYYGFKSDHISANIELSNEDEFTILKYDYRFFYYPKNISINKAKRNFLSVLEEQSINHPHHYNIEKVENEWVVYDFGPAEGFQIHKFIEKGAIVFAFEPDIQFYKCLLRTFKKEIEMGVVKIYNIGLGFINNNDKFISDISAIVKMTNHVYPQYIKADIEGSELYLTSQIGEIMKSKKLKLIDITTYHRPDHITKIPEQLSKYGGHGYFSDGLIILNIDSWENTGKYNKLHHPIIRKVLYTHEYNN